VQYNIYIVSVLDKRTVILLSLYASLDPDVIIPVVKSAIYSEMIDRVLIRTWITSNGKSQV
jgi:hypothetical protein